MNIGRASGGNASMSFCWALASALFAAGCKSCALAHSAAASAAVSRGGREKRWSSATYTRSPST